MSDEKKNPDEIGALWSRQSQKGEYLTGTINGVAVVCFLNRNKQDGDNKPLWRVLKSKPRDARADAAPARDINRDLHDDRGMDW